MTYITASEDALLRTQPHRTKLHLSIYQPPTVMAAQINDTVSKGERIIPYGSVSEGSHLAVEAGMTMFVGTTAGANDRGSVRVRSITADEITVAENSHIDWDENDHLTIIRFWEIQAIYPRIIQDPADDENTLWYKDYDVEYSDQNSVLGSFICMGPHHAGFIDGASEEVYYTATGTNNLNDDAMSYEWHFEGGTPTGSTSAVPGWISYDTPGHYTTKLRVTTGEGADDVSYRHVSIYDRPAEGTNVPFLDWELEQLSGDIQQAGYMARIRIRDDVDEDTIIDGALVVIFADDWYGDTNQSIGGNAENRQNIVFTGYIQSGTIQWNYRDGYVVFEVVSPSSVMKDHEGFAVSVQSVQNPSQAAATDENIPSGWVAIQNMTTSKAIYHYLYWHSTALYCNDFQYVADNLQIQYYDANRDSIYSAIQELMDKALIGGFSCDRQGKMWCVQEPNSNNDALTENPPAGQQAFHITNMNWIGDPIITERQTPLVSFLEIGGVAYYGPASGTFNAYMSSAPGSAPNYGGGVLRHQGLALTTQENLNILAGNMFAFANSRYPSITMSMAGNYRNLDITPRRFINLTVDAADTPRGIQITSRRFNPFNIVWNYDSENEFMHPVVSVREITQGFAGDAIAIPNEPPLEAEDGGSVDQPPITVPPLPPPAIPPIIGTSEYFVARFSVETLTAAISTDLTIENFVTNSTAVATSQYVLDPVGDVWMVSIWVYSKYTSSYTLYVNIKPCPGQIVDGDFFFPASGVDNKTRDALFSAGVDGGYGYEIASKAYSFPVVTHLGEPRLAQVNVKAPLVNDVMVTAAAVGIKIRTALNTWSATCPLP